MKKATGKTRKRPKGPSVADNMRDEYDFTGGVRGKYVTRLGQRRTPKKRKRA